MIRLSKCSIKNLHMRLFYLTPSLIGSINHEIFLLTNGQVVLMGLKLCIQVNSFPIPSLHPNSFFFEATLTLYTAFHQHSDSDVTSCSVFVSQRIFARLSVAPRPPRDQLNTKNADVTALSSTGEMLYILHITYTFVVK